MWRYGLGQAATDDVLDLVRSRRIQYREYLAVRTQKAVAKSLRDISRVAFLLTSSRGGSSVTMNLLSQQACSATSGQGKILTVPGEHKPYLVLAGFYWPGNERLSDELLPTDAAGPSGISKLAILEQEMMSEIGFPLKSSGDLSLYALQLYGRLILQWPGLATAAPLDVVGCLERILRQTTTELGTSGRYFDAVEYRTHLIYALHQEFPIVNPLYYDRIEHRLIDSISVTELARQSEGPPGALMIEEPPFIVAPPWAVAEERDIEQGVLLLKDPSDVWRLGFWAQQFRGAQQLFLHLTREPTASIRRIVSGWRYPYGFFSVPLPRPANIAGFADGTTWRGRFTSFSCSAMIIEALVSGNVMELEEIAALQWCESHDAILQWKDDPRYFRIASCGTGAGTMGFEWVVKETSKAMSAICTRLKVPVTRSLEEASLRMAANHVMCIPYDLARPERGHVSSENERIIQAAARSGVRETAATLGYAYA